MKRMIKRIACFTLALGLCFGGVACQQAPTDEPLKEQIEYAYLARLNESKNEYDSVEVLKFLGEYNGNTVAYTVWGSDTLSIDCDIIDCTVDGVMLCQMARNNDIVVYNAEQKTVKRIDEAYKDGDLSLAHLWQIKFTFLVPDEPSEEDAEKEYPIVYIDKYAVGSYDLLYDDYEPVRSAKCGERVVVKTTMPTDVDVLVYANGERVPSSSPNSWKNGYHEYTFTMPAQGVVITFELKGGM